MALQFYRVEWPKKHKAWGLSGVKELLIVRTAVYILSKRLSSVRGQFPVHGLGRRDFISC